MQSIILQITELEGNGAAIKLDGDFSNSFFVKALTAFLKSYPDYIPVFLDATGAALIGTDSAAISEAERFEVISNIYSNN